MTELVCPGCGRKAFERRDGAALCVSGCGWNNMTKPAPPDTRAEFMAQIFGEGDPLTPAERAEREALRTRHIAAARKEMGDRRKP